MQRVKNWDFPKIGKYMYLAMLSIELFSYLFLCYTASEKTSFRISLYLAFVAAVNILLVLCAIVPRIYYYYTKLFIVVVISVLFFRILGIIFLFKFSN